MAPPRAAAPYVARCASPRRSPGTARRRRRPACARRRGRSRRPRPARSTSASVTRAAVAIIGLKLRALQRYDEVAHRVAAPRLDEREVARDRLFEHVPAGHRSRSSPCPRPRWCRTRSACRSRRSPRRRRGCARRSVPCGTNSTSSEPSRYWRSNVAFSPTYELIIFLICRVASSSPIPKSSTPQLLLTTVRSLTPSARMPAIRFSGMPHRPNPPASTIAPSLSPARASASAAFATTLFMRLLRPASAVRASR